jgi:light-harvesting complex II chlorophyll a/b binding protein 7
MTLSAHAHADPMAGSRAARLTRSSSSQRQSRHLSRWRARSTAETVEILIFAATPFLAVQAFADSDTGKAIFDRLKEEKPALEKEAARAAERRRDVRAKDPVISRFYPTPDSYPGDVGFDPLHLSKDETAMEKYFEYELLHGRWAMLGALGAIIPELFPGSLPKDGTLWWNVGYYKLTSGEDLNYFGVEGLHVAGNQGVLIIAIAQVLLMFGPEYARSCGIEALEPLGIFLPGDAVYPGGVLFDPLNVSKDPVLFERNRVCEVKHARLAMMAWVVFAGLAVARQPIIWWR